jgi:hypothetical protein
MLIKDNLTNFCTKIPVTSIRAREKKLLNKVSLKRYSNHGGNLDLQLDKMPDPDTH